MKSLLLAVKDWFICKRVGRTLTQVFGGVAVALLLDWGKDGAVVLRDYVFGDQGVIVIGTMALALWMNRKGLTE